MSASSTRRQLLKNTGTGLLGLSGLQQLFPPVSAQEARLDPRLVRFDSGIEPLVRLIEQTPRNRLLEEVGGRIKRGLSYRDVVTALFLAGVRDIRPHGGDNFHAVLVIHAAHQASLAAADSDRWIPIFWALDEFKRAQSADGNWRMAPVEDARVPAARQARQAFADAVTRWDAVAAESAVVGLVRSAGAAEVFDLLAVHGAGNFGFLGHNAIFVANGWRTLQCIGWQHAEPVLRSLARVVFELRPDALWRGNRELAATIPAAWQEGQPSPQATTELLALMRQASPDVCRRAVELLRGGAAPQSIWDAAFVGVAELLMRQPARPESWQRGIFALHAVTALNALRYAYSASGQDETRRLLFLQGAALVPYFLETMRRRGGEVTNGRLDQLEPAPLTGGATEAVAEIFADVGSDRTLAVRKALTLLREEGASQRLIDAARHLVFHKGIDTHDYKFSTAVFEDYTHITPAWRDRYLASALHIFRGSADRDSTLLNRTRAALQG